MVMPSISKLQRLSHIQDQVGAWIKELQTAAEKGKCQSQKGGSETVFVKHEILWPQNYVLGGSTKSRLSCNSLSLSQWVVGFAKIIRDE